MGLTESHVELFPHRQRALDADDDPGDALAQLLRVELAQWRVVPTWLQDHRQRLSICSDDVHKSISTADSDAIATPTTDFTTPMTTSQALSIVPELLDDRWVSPLVALIDSVDVVIQSTGLALLARVIRSEGIFVSVHGIAKVMTLLGVDNVASNVRFLALQVVHALCSRNRAYSYFSDTITSVL
ncbi:hypothetical protein PINS_up013789 [Pythium insidiosum]|nr:hypothetical protein PINS_up013789 [Pythium insidiosum]